MRLLKRASNGDIELTPPVDGDPPQYAILSHRWGGTDEEVLFEDITNGAGRDKKGFQKIQFCSEQAARHNLEYFWVDTCCINKAWPGELQTAILSMFQWYQRSTRCYVYLSDVPEAGPQATWEQAFRESKWFTRGWTLQELLAPTSVEFFAADGGLLDNKHSLVQTIHKITGISREALQGEPLFHFNDTTRMRWQELRRTEREEDIAYSLLGIFGVDMDLRYGEGKIAALKRLEKKREEFKSCCQDLYVINPADHKKSIVQKKGDLFQDSYQWIFQHPDFQKWLCSKEHRFLWIKGDPGKGKTMLLCGIINELPKLIEKTAILSYFFCEATDSRTNSATAVLRGLIYMLLLQQSSLISHLQKKYENQGKALFDDSNAWFAVSEIFTNMLQDQTLNSTYIVIDGLDECATADLSKLLEFIATTSSVSTRVRWIVSSRNWSEIEKDLDIARHKVKLALELNENAISAAVSSYIQFKVDNLAQRNRYSSSTKQSVQNHFSRNAEGTFLWVALACQELEKVPNRKVQEKLKSFPPGLDALYGRMMDQIRISDDYELCMQILAAISVVYRPITLDELVVLVDMPDELTGDDEALSEMIGLCGSFLTLRGRTILFVHQSAKEFLVEKACKEIYPSGMEEVHYTIYAQSLRAINASGMLKRDVYRLSHPGTLISEIKTPDPDPLGPVRYSCVYWVQHLRDGSNDGERYMISETELAEDGPIASFLKKKFLYWLEALSLLRCVSNGIVAIMNLKTLVDVSGDCRKQPWTILTTQQSPESQLGDIIHDVYRFILHNKGGIEIAPLQTYSSALLFSPAQSLVRRLFEKEEIKWITLKPSISRDWNPCLQTLEGHGSSISAVAFSPDGKTVASGSYDKTVRLWDTASGAARWTLEGHSGWISAVAFSPDGKTVASGSDDKTVRLWDTASGTCMRIFQIATIVEDLAFSDDGYKLNTNLGALKLDNILVNPRSQPPLEHSSLIIQNEWILQDGKRLLWLHPDARPTRTAFHGRSFALAFNSGQVEILTIELAGIDADDFGSEAERLV